MNFRLKLPSLTTNVKMFKLARLLLRGPGTSNIVTQNLISNTQTYKIRKKEKQNKFNLTQFDKLDRFYFNLPFDLFSTGLISDLITC